MVKAPTRHFTHAFKFQLCTQIRAGAIGRREAQRAHNLSGNLIQDWLGKFERGELDPSTTPEDAVARQHEERIAELEHLVVKLSLDNDRLRTTIARASAVNDNSPAKKALGKTG